jgi:BirA family biotin operon repressor/biotin-[acetyl-CoA-carboxylase] ligase
MKIDSVLISNLINQKLKVITYEEIDSTNNVCKTLGNSGEINKLVISSYQTAGRGRLGRTFISEKDKGIYMSLLIKPNISLTDVSKVTCVVATSISKVLEKIINKKIDIKWVNDLYLNNKKICGILTESSIIDNKINYLVIGIGINLYHQVFPKDIIASSIEDETGVLINQNELIGKITNQILEDIELINNKTHLEYYRKRLYLKGKSVELNIRGEIFNGTVVDINDDFELIVNIDEKEKIVTSGEIIKVKIKEEVI